MKYLIMNLPVRFTMLYLLFSASYIFITDNLLTQLSLTSEKITEIQTYKGWGFVPLSGLIIYLILKELTSNTRKQIEQIKKKRICHGFDDKKT